MREISPEAYPNTLPVQHCVQVLRARGQCTVLSPEHLGEIRTFEFPAVTAPEEHSANVAPIGAKLLPAPRS